ncbi:MAG: citrate synthase, partial [Clostridia bacterium]|nr:citrate synthase [Clostridia bacterium]
LCNEFKEYNNISPTDYKKYQVKCGLRNEDGTGVMAGLTSVCNIKGYVVDDGERVPVDGVLNYRGINVNDIIKGCADDKRLGFEEVVWLLLFGALPDKDTLNMFRAVLADNRELPQNFAEDMIMKAPSRNIMNKLARSVLALYSYDDDPDNIDIKNVLGQCISVIAKLPIIMSHAYQVKRRYFDSKSMFIHPLQPELSTAETILRSIRANRQYTEEEARLLDLCLILHADHGGGNNSTFTTRVLTSSHTDTYATLSAAIGSLKGPRHGGANLKVSEMLNYMMKELPDIEDDTVKDYLAKIVRKEAADKSGLIYGMGHAVYTKSDPRAVILKKEAEKVAVGTELEKEYRLLEKIEKFSPDVLNGIKGTDKTICANVDLYSGLVYRSLKIPPDLFTPLFAVARMSGWCAHRLEELATCKKIIRPAYKAVAKNQIYIPMNER